MDPELNDLRVTLSNTSPKLLAISVKSNRQVTQSGFPREFVEAARVCCGTESNRKLPHDLVGLAVGQLAGQVRECWHALLREARLGSPRSVAIRYTSEKQSNAIGRALFRSLADENTVPDAETVLLVQRVRLFHFDFTENESRDEARATEMCQLVLASGQSDEAVRLWRRLVGIAAERRAAGGALSYPELIEALGGEFALKDRADHRRDWEMLDRRSAEIVNAVRDTVGGRVSLVRHELMDTLRSRIWEGGSVLIAGEAGTGKSSVVKQLAQAPDLFDRCFWLNAAALDFDSLADVERFLGINNRLEALLAAGSGVRACMVLDGLERFGERALDRAKSLLQLLAPDPSIRGWTVFVTTRPQAVYRAHLLLMRAEIAANDSKPVYIQPLSDRECSAVLETCPELNSPHTRRELRSTLSNLKILDWLADARSNFSTSEIRSWSGTTGVIDSLWRRWIGDDAASAARSGVMKQIARLDGDGLLRGVGTSDLNTPEQSALGDLESRDLVTIDAERVVFRHDMLGDWARLRILIEKSPRGQSLTEYARYPRWHDAIRLYGQRLLEVDEEAPTRWVDALASVDGDAATSVVVRDLFVDGLFLAPHASGLLERAWPALIENGGVLLRRMLNRFQHAGTIPDPRFISKASPTEETSELATFMRLPWWPLWPSVLTTLREQSNDVARLCPIEAAQVCALWLRHLPVGCVGRTDASSVALAIGREIQAARGEGVGSYRDHADTVVFEAVLLAAPDYPEDVATLCLELARRRPDPPEVIARAKAHQERVAREVAARLAKNPPPKNLALGMPPLSLGDEQWRPQFPDGPASRVDDALQRAVLDTQGILALASVLPDQAMELLLACCLEPPCYVRRHGSWSMNDHFGVVHTPSYHPSMFFRGPWLPLLRSNPSLGVACIIRLVDHATEQWERQELGFEPTSDQVAESSVSVAFHDHNRIWRGSMRTYGWHREWFLGTSLLSSALMALERYLYECADQDVPIDEVVAEIFATGRSVATLAVLVAAAKHKSALLTGCLRPLLGAWPLYGWDLRLTLEGADTWRIGFFQWARAGEAIFNLVRDWHTMPHRKHIFHDQVSKVLLTDPGTHDAFVSICAAWQTELENGSCSDPDALARLIARFDPNNYKLAPRDDGTYAVVFEWPQEMRRQTEDDLRRAESGMHLIAFPLRCRQLLEQAAPLSDADAQQIWGATQEFFSSTEQDTSDDIHMHRRDDAIAGGIAVLFTLAPEWVAAHSEQSIWCHQQIARLLSDPPPPARFDSEFSISTDRWHSFLADLAIILFAENATDPNTRDLAAQSVLSAWQVTTHTALLAAYRVRKKLGDDLDKLINLAVLWTALKATILRDAPSGREADRFCARAARLQYAFVRDRIPAEALDWIGISGIAMRARDRVRRRQYPDLQEPLPPKRRAAHRPAIRRSRRDRLVRHHPGFDIEALQHAFGWLPNPAGLCSEDTQRCVTLMEQLLGVTLRMIPSEPDGDHEVEGAPYTYDNWVLVRVATFVAQLDSDQDAQRLWRPIMELGPAAHYWVESFLGAWTTSAYTEAATPSLYFARWRELIRFAIESSRWSPTANRAPRLPDLWETLMGMGLGASILGADGSQPEFAQMKSLYAHWADRLLHGADSLRSFANLLRQSGARPLLNPAVPHLLRAAKELRTYEWKRHPVADDLAAVMSTAWTWNSNAIGTDAKLLKDFMELLNILIAQQSRRAMALRDVVARRAVLPQG